MNTPNSPLRPNRFALRSLAVAASATLLCSFAASAAVVFTNDFQANTNGFSAGTLQSLPTDAGGFASANQSNYLGLFSNQVTSTNLAISGLTAGTSYLVSFDLFGGRTLDGNTSPGPDRFTLSTGTTTLVDATFSNISDRVQTYSDSTPTAGVGGNVAAFTGADVSFNVGDIFQHYSIYSFGKGAATNPQLSFVATGPTATLSFVTSGLQDASDEFFAIDNVVVTGPDQPTGRVPDNGTTLVLLGGAFVAMIWIRRRMAMA